MMLFLVLLLFVLWLFQVVFFGRIYKLVRVAEIKSAADELCDSIELEGTELAELARDIALERQMCVLIVSEDGTVIVSEDILTDCIVHTMSGRNIYTVYSFAKRDGGENLSRFSLNVFREFPRDRGGPRPMPNGGGAPVRDVLPESTQDSSAESIIFTKLTDCESRGTEVAVMLNATVSPVTSTVRTLQTELIIISAVMILLAVLLSFILARRVAGPIVRINESAKQLAAGNYNADFSAGGYREIAELSDTLSYAASELSKTGTLQRELIANISHDLRTPLTMITGYAEIMRDLPGENTPENVQIIIDEAQRLTSLVNDVLDISKFQSGIQTLEREDFDLTATVREVIGRFGKLTDAQGYTIHFDCGCNVVVNADRNRILQVIYNFINNALTHCGEDKTVTVTQRLVTRPDGSCAARIEVTDSGDGIAKEDIPYIWDRYYKVDKLHKRAQTGSGLGLSIVKSILELHNAAYGVNTEQGKGSTFWFEL